MLLLRRRLCFVLAVLAGLCVPAFATETAFPFGSSLVLDAAPLPGTKRVPMIEIDENGDASFYLWCASARGSANVGQDTISLTPTTALPLAQAPTTPPNAPMSIMPSSPTANTPARSERMPPNAANMSGVAMRMAASRNSITPASRSRRG